MSKAVKLPKLGRGLESVIGRSFIGGGKSIIEVPIEEVEANHYQPRKVFDEEAIKSLSHSIQQNGLAQPIVVRSSESGGYELIAGERRLRACKLAGFSTIPAIVKNVSDKQSLCLALVENLDREDLNCIEQAKGYHRLLDEFDYTHEQISELFGRSRSSVTNSLRLLALPGEVVDALMDNIITEGHGRALLAAEGVDEILACFATVVDKKLSVRATESLVSELSKPAPEPLTLDFEGVAAQTALVESLRKKLGDKEGIKISTSGRDEKGAITFRYKNKEDLDRLMALFDQL